MNKKTESKEETNKELSELMIAIILFMVLTCLFGYIGYKFCIDNNYDIQRGIVFGAIFPLGLAILKELNFGNIRVIREYKAIDIVILNDDLL